MPHEESPEQGSRAAQIAHLNDAFRKSTQEVMVTQGVQALPDVMGLVRVFDTFTPDNDPYGEHDFGSINWHQAKTFWKIDYYDQQLQYWQGKDGDAFANFFPRAQEIMHRGKRAAFGNSLSIHRNGLTSLPRFSSRNLLRSHLEYRRARVHAVRDAARLQS